MAACVEAAATVAVRAPGAVRPTTLAAAHVAIIDTTDDYEPTCLLGKGAFDDVVKARQRGTGQTMAIQRLAATDISSQKAPYGLAGTLWYMAPEMLLGKPNYDALVNTF